MERQKKKKKKKKEARWYCPIGRVGRRRIRAKTESMTSTK